LAATHSTEVALGQCRCGGLFDSLFFGWMIFSLRHRVGGFERRDFRLLRLRRFSGLLPRVFLLGVAHDHTRYATNALNGLAESIPLARRLKALWADGDHAQRATRPVHDLERSGDHDCASRRKLI